MTQPAVPYAGIATRAIALAIDVAIVNVIVLCGGAILALVGSLVGDVRMDTLKALLADRGLVRGRRLLLRPVLEHRRPDARACG